MYLLGTVVILCGILLAALATVSYALVPFGRVGALPFARFGTRAAFVAVLLVVGLLNYLFVAQRYDIQYVYDYSSRILEPEFRVAAVWAGQPGSFVIWALWGMLAAQFLVGRTRHNEPYVLSVFMLIQTALLVFMLIRNPFVPYMENGVPAVPLDGKGLNPTLHNIWMIIHPPILFVGFALMAIPFAYAIAGLVRRDYDGWIKGALPWTVAGWMFLGFAMMLGGYWAYETLGWGGYWGWDPVENASLVPWLLGTALIHGMLVQRSSGGLRRTNMVIAILTYIMVFYATFLTRSGVLSSFSVHSFVEEGLKAILFAFLAILIVLGVGALVWRWRDIPSRALSEKLLSRDSFFVLMILGMVLMATLVGVATSMPVISGIPGVGHTLQSWFGALFELDDGTTFGGPGTQPFQDGRFGLVPSFYATTMPPLGMIIVALLTVGPLLGWHDTNLRHLLRALRFPALFAVIGTCVALVLGARDWQAVAYIGLGVFAVGTNLVMIIRTLRGGWLRIGGYLAHLGLMVFLIGVVASSLYATPELRILVPQGDTISAYGYEFTFNGWRMTPDERGVLDLTVAKGNDSFQATPQLYFNPGMGATMATPSIKTELTHDVYISPAEYQPPFDRNIIDINIGETGEVGPYQFTFLGFEVPNGHSTGAGDVAARLKVQYEGQETELTPAIALLTNETDPARAIKDLPVTLPGGHSASMVAFDPDQRRVIIRVEGLNLPVDPAKAVVTVSLKPLVQLVWLGVLICALGGMIAVLRRTLEGRAPAGQRARLPRTLGGLIGR